MDLNEFIVKRGPVELNIDIANEGVHKKEIVVYVPYDFKKTVQYIKNDVALSSNFERILSETMLTSLKKLNS